ncbi:MAG: VOC family protein [Rhodobacteraceae bacterium]|nr:VOC family protein [Paracoccaceae bacterium]
MSTRTGDAGGLRLDHLVVGCRDLDAGAATVEAALGVALRPGGRHPHFGTHNRLLGLGDVYLEVVAPEPGAVAEAPRMFALDGFSGPPRLLAYVCSVPDLDAALAGAPPELGPGVALSRGGLTWRLTVPEDGSLPEDGALPALIEWGAGVTRPPETLPDDGCRLLRLEIAHPDAVRIAAALGIRDARVRYDAGPPGLKAEIATPAGPRWLC